MLFGVGGGPVQEVWWVHEQNSETPTRMYENAVTGINARGASHTRSACSRAANGPSKHEALKSLKFDSQSIEI